jgi:hypothetical protein
LNSGLHVTGDDHDLLPDLISVTPEGCELIRRRSRRRDAKTREPVRRIDLADAGFDHGSDSAGDRVAELRGSE